MLLGYKKCVECAVEVNIKGDNSVTLYFQGGLSPKSRQIGMNNDTFHHIDPTT